MSLVRLCCSLGCSFRGKKRKLESDFILSLQFEHKIQFFEKKMQFLQKKCIFSEFISGRTCAENPLELITYHEKNRGTDKQCDVSIKNT